MTDYEAIRDSGLLAEAVREDYIKAEQASRGLRREYEQLTQDQDLTHEARTRRAQELFEQRRGSVEAAGKKARESILKQAKSAEQGSMPKPSGEGLTSSSSDRILLDQNEASRVIRTIERKKAAPGPFKHDTGAYLTQEYARGLEIGGVEGGAICRGTLRAADELGIDPDQVVDPLRDDKHRESLDRARRLYWFSDTVSESAPAIPRKLDGRKPKRVPGSYSSAPSALVPGADGPPIMASTDSGGAKKKTRRKKNFS
jgi:hypothetical protein